MAGAATPPLLRIGVLALLVLQNTSLRLVMKHARTVSPNFSATAAVFACEVLKFTTAIAVLARVRRSLTTALVEVLNYRELLPMLVPAALYLLADRLHHVSTRRLDVAAFQVLSQSKVLTAALFGKVFRGRDYSSRQWFCLCAIAGGIAICQLADIGVDTVPMPDLLGVATVMTTSLLGAAAGTHIEATLQRGSGDGVLWKRAAQMAANGCLIAAGPASRSNLDGFVFSAWLVVALNAAGGLLVAAAMRYADNVLKTLAASLSIVVSDRGHHHERAGAFIKVRGRGPGGGRRDLRVRHRTGGIVETPRGPVENGFVAGVGANRLGDWESPTWLSVGYAIGRVAAPLRAGAQAAQRFACGAARA